jgi:hypothetical protein
MSFAVSGSGVAFGVDSEGPGDDVPVEEASDGQDSMIPIELPAVTIEGLDTDADGPADADVSTTIVPATPRSEQVTAVDALVTIPGGVQADLVEVTLCLFLVGSESDVAGCLPEGGIGATWNDERPDATSHLVMTWRPDRVITTGGTETGTDGDPDGEGDGDGDGVGADAEDGGPVVVEDHGFRILGDAQHADAGSTSDLVDLGADAAEVGLSFRFQTSVGLRAGDESWAVRVVALDANGNHSAGSDPAVLGDTPWQRSGLTVAEFRAVISRSPVAFGALLPGGAITVDGVTSGSFLSNAPSALTITSTDFTHDGREDGSGDVSVIRMRDEDGEPDVGELILDCNAGATFDAAAAIRVGNSPGADRFLERDLYATGTGEAADGSRVHSCRMAYGGGAAAIGREHAGTIAISIVAAP